MIVGYQSQKEYGNLLVIVAIALISALLVIVLSAVLGERLPLLTSGEKDIVFLGSVIFLVGIVTQTILAIKRGVS